MLQECAVDELIDPRLENCYSEHEIYCMLHAASLCIRRDPQARPRMSQVSVTVVLSLSITLFSVLVSHVCLDILFLKVLRILEGDLIMESGKLSTTPGYDVGNHSGRIWSDAQQQCQRFSGSSDGSEEFSAKLSFDKRNPSNVWDRSTY